MSDNGKIIYIWGDPTICVSNFDSCDGYSSYALGSIAITQHYDDIEDAGSIMSEKNKGALFIDKDQIKCIIAALQEFL